MRLLAWLAAFLLLIATTAAVLLAAAIDREPLVTRPQSISPDSVAQARRLLAGNDPRHLRSGERRQIRLPAGLIDDGLNHLAGLRFGGRAAFAVGEDGGDIRVSLPLPQRLGGYYLNLRATLRPGDGEPQFGAARIGALPVPAAAVDAALAAIAARLGYGEEWRLTRQAVRWIGFAPSADAVDVGYEWRPEILDRARDIAVAPADVAHLEDAQRRLAALLAGARPGESQPLVKVLAPLLHPPANAEAAPETAAARRRAGLLVLASYMAGRGLAAVVPAAKTWPQATPLALTLRGRHDSAQHFVVSAALAAWAGEPVADAIGLYKELEDARRGSGFSFADLAADRAGTRFGEQSKAAPQAFTALLARPPTDADLLPPLDGLPEYLGEREFTRRYGGIDSPAYRKLADEIERRIAALPAYR